MHDIGIVIIIQMHDIGRDMGVEPKIGGKHPKSSISIGFWNHDFHHPFWGSIIFFLSGGFSPTPLKNMRTVKLDHFPRDRGENTKIFELPPPRKQPGDSE